MLSVSPAASSSANSQGLSTALKSLALFASVSLVIAVVLLVGDAFLPHAQPVPLYSGSLKFRPASSIVSSPFLFNNPPPPAAAAVDVKVVRSATSNSSTTNTSAPSNSSTSTNTSVVTTPAATPASPASDTIVDSYIVLGDWGCPGQTKPFNPSDPENYTAEHLMEVQIAHQLTNFTRANQLEDDIDFIISVGDNFYEDGVQNVTDPLWDRLYERVFSDPVTQHPWYIVAGNHDYGSPANITAQVEYTQRSNRWYFPALHYSKTYQLPQNKTMAVIYMYTGALADGTPEEGKVENDWLESQLQLYSLKTEFLFVVGHHPVISVGEHGNTAEMVHAKMLFDKYGVTAYFGGHDHIMQYLTDSGIHYFGSGGGCKLQGEVHPDRVLPTTKLVYAEHINGFMVNTVAADGMSQTVTIVNQDGVAVGKYTIQGRQKIIQ